MEHTIIEKKVLADITGARILRMEILAPSIARHARAGQFVVVIAHPKGERVPLTIAETNTIAGTITLIFQEAGLTTRVLGRLEKNDSLFALVGPLGNATTIKYFGDVYVIGGGVGIAEIYPVAKALKEAKNRVTVIIGAKTKALLVLESDLKKTADSFYVTTDDGSYGRIGFVTQVLEEIMGKSSAGVSLVYTVGPLAMMAKVAQITTQHNIATLVSLNALMVDATGMCGCCRVTVGGRVRFSCVDGPEFDAHAIDWQELMRRNSMYCDKEQHICKLNLSK
jgi:NAD(P)H-flavin reductase